MFFIRAPSLRSRTAMGDYWSLSPESLYQVAILFSDCALPQGYRHINGYGSHAFSLWNDAGERYRVKFHFKTMQGHKHWANEEANEVIANDRESSQRDLYDAIEGGVVELNRNPAHYFAEIEQSSFSPSNIVPRIGFSPDKGLQSRISGQPIRPRRR